MLFQHREQEESELLVKLMKKLKIGSVYHESRPRMFYGSKLIFGTDKSIIQLKKIAYINSRYDLLKKAYYGESRFVETNNHTIFFMDAIAEMFLNRVNE